MALMIRDGVTHNPVNIGNPSEVMVRDLAELVLRITGSRSHVSYRPLPEDDPCRRRPDISLAQRELDGWSPKVGLEDGLKRTIDYFRKVCQSKIPQA